MSDNLTRLRYIKAFNTLDIVEYDPSNSSETYKLRRSLMSNFISGVYYDYDNDIYFLKVLIGNRSFTVTDRYYDFITACMELDKLIDKDPLIRTKRPLTEDGKPNRDIKITGKEIEFILRWRNRLDMAELASMLDMSMSVVGDILQKTHSDLHTTPQKHTFILWDVRDKYNPITGAKSEYLTNSVDDFLDL